MICDFSINDCVFPFCFSFAFSFFFEVVTNVFAIFFDAHVFGA